MGHALQALAQATDIREATRVDLHLRIMVAAGSQAEPVEGVLVNIAPDGLLVQTPLVVSAGAPVTLSFRMLARRVCEARGHVLWYQDASFEMTLDECNPGMHSFIYEISKLPMSLRQIYLADILHPRIEVSV